MGRSTRPTALEANLALLRDGRYDKLQVHGLVGLCAKRACRDDGERCHKQANKPEIDRGHLIHTRPQPLPLKCSGGTTAWTGHSPIPV